jgi:hypothetical protein
MSVDENDEGAWPSVARELQSELNKSPASMSGIARGCCCVLLQELFLHSFRSA